MGVGLGNSTALITDGRFSGASKGFIIGVSRLSLKPCYLRSPLPGHVVPEATLGGPIALVKDGDRIIIDAASRTIDWLVEEDEKTARKKEWETSGKSALKERRGILYRYARDVAVSDIHAPSSCLCVPDSFAKAGQRRRIHRLIFRCCLCIVCMYKSFVYNSSSDASAVKSRIVKFVNASCTRLNSRGNDDMSHSITTAASYVLNKYSRSYPSTSSLQGTQAPLESEWQHFTNPVMRIILEAKKSPSGQLVSMRLRILWSLHTESNDLHIDQREVVFVSNSSNCASVDFAVRSDVVRPRKTWSYCPFHLCRHSKRPPPCNQTRVFL